MLRLPCSAKPASRKVKTAQVASLLHGHRAQAIARSTGYAVTAWIRWPNTRRAATNFEIEERVLERQFNRIGNWRLVIGLSAAVLAWFIFAKHVLGLRWLTLPLMAFLFLVILHQRVIRRRTLVNRAIAFYERGIARLRDEWIGKGSLGERFRNPAHVYSEDLDLFGRGSLFDLIAITRTAAGEDTLASWLVHPASLEEGTVRQAAVSELRPKLNLREDFALLAAGSPLRR